MKDDPREDDQLRSVTLENARSLLARQRAEEELAHAREALSRQSEWLRVTLASIGDAVVTTDTDGRVLSLNRVAEGLTGWVEQEAQGRPLAEVVRLVGEASRQPVEDPAGKALREGRVVGLANHTILVARDGTEIPIDDSAAPIRDDLGRSRGVVLIFRSIAERRRNEENQARLAAIVESSQDAIVSKTLDSRIVSWNAGAEQLFGYRAEEVIGRPITLLIPPERQDEEREILERIRRGERVQHYETVRISKEGRRVDVSLTISPVRDGAGRVVGASKIARDITTRKRTEQRLATQSRVTQALAESAGLRDAAPKILRAICEELDWPVGVLWSVGEDGKALRCAELHHLPSAPIPRFEAACRERAFARDVGLPGRVWAGGQPAWICDVTRDGNFPRAGVAAAEGLHGAFGVPIVVENRVVGVLELFSQGAREPDRDLLQVMNAIGSQVGEFIERKRAEEELRDSEQKRRFLAEASAALADLTDQESTLQKVAALAVPHFADWCAVDVPEADGSVRRLAVSHVDPAKVRLVRELDRRFPSRPWETRWVRQVIRTGEPEWAASVDEMLAALTPGEEHLRIVRDLGLRSYICVPLNSRARVLGALTFVRGESARAYDADDVRAAEDLAHRTVIAIENASLLATLRDADRRKNEFLAMLAHELRNPLAPIGNAVQIFRAKGPPVPELQWATEVIGRQVHQMTRLVDDLLDVSRITRGKIELRREVLELATVVGSAVEASRPLIDKWGHELTVTVPPHPILLDADPTRLAQVVSNLLNNAAKYTEHGGRIGLIAEQEGDQVAIRVNDNGVGIPAEMRPRIFDLFAQADRSLERSEGGLGIGLTLVQRLVQMHGGSVEARSEGPGKGSEFVVRLPIARAAARPAPRGAESGQPVAGPRALRILVVDDNHDAADSLGMLLRMMGNEVHTAHDGVEALGAVAAFHPDVVLLDLGLPKLDGFEVADRIREQRGGADVLLVALTGWGRSEDRRRSREAGFDHHMTKPVEFKALQQFLAEATRARSERGTEPGT
ncbi:MAG TPA: PAS domain S-box protein [Vicinamibacteria bacterium]|nr:PAS domain S-box protein [Vicinamibacteria bacterium]